MGFSHIFEQMGGKTYRLTKRQENILSFIRLFLKLEKYYKIKQWVICVIIDKVY